MNNEVLKNIIRVLADKKDYYTIDSLFPEYLPGLPKEQEALDSNLGKACWTGERLYSSSSDSIFKFFHSITWLRKKLTRDVKVVDVGCGIAKVGVISKLFEVDYVGIDICPHRIKLAKELMNDVEGDKIKLSDVSKDPLPVGDVYYMYDPVNLKTLKHLSFPAGSFIYFKPGREETQKYIQDTYIQVGPSLYYVR